MKRTACVLVALLAVLTWLPRLSFAQPYAEGPRMMLQKLTPVEKLRLQQRTKEVYPLLGRVKQLAASPSAIAEVPEVFTMGRPAFMAGSPVTSARVAAATGGTDMFGNLVEYYGWERGETKAYGIYGFNSLAPSEFSPLMVDNLLTATGGGAIVDGKFYCIYADFTYILYNLVFVSKMVYDAETWELLEQSYLDSYDLYAVATATDYTTGTVYGQVLNEAFDEPMLAIIDYKTDTRQVIGGLHTVYAAMGITSDGTLYGVAADGKLWRISTDDATETLIGDTGVKIADRSGDIFGQSGDIDKRTDTFYWMATRDDGTGGFYTVDLTTGAATEIESFGTLQMYAMTVPPVPAEEKAPAMASDMQLDFQDEQTSGTVTFTAPTTTFDEEDQLQGQLDYAVAFNDEVLASGHCQPGERVTATVTATAGLNRIAVTTANSHGSSPKLRLTAWLGYDYPEAPVDVTLDIDGRSGEVSLVWDAPEAGIHNGYLGDLRYDVYRIAGTDTVLVKQGIDDTSFEETLPKDKDPMTYRYGVVADNHDLLSAMATSDGCVFGKALDLPFYEDFATAGQYSRWTVVDGNKDGRIWQYDAKNGLAQSPYQPEVAGDDWLIAPAVELEGGRPYLVSFRAANFISSKAALLQLAIGQGNAAENMATTICDPIELKTSTSGTHTVEFTVPASGDYNIGFHDISAVKSYGLTLDSIFIEAGVRPLAPAAVEGLEIVPDAKGALKATISFTTPTTTADGSALEQIEKVEILRGLELVTTINAPAPGTRLSFDDTEGLENGVNTYTVTAYNAQGNGQKVLGSAFVGIDVPVAPATFTATERNGKVTFSWDAVDAVGVNGGYVDAATVEYVVYEVNSQGEATDIVETVSGATSLETTIEANSGKQKLGLWALAAQNATGRSQLAGTSLVVGEPYALPFRESFEGGKLANFWYYQRSSANAVVGVTADMASDADGGALIFMSKQGEQSASFNSGKISLDAAANPKLVFSYLAGYGQHSTLQVVAQRPNGQEDVLESIDMGAVEDSTHWQEVRLPLAGYVADGYAQLKLQCALGATDDVVLVDNVNVADVLNHNLAAIISVPNYAYKGTTASVDVTVRNQGEQAAADYAVRLYADNQLVGDTVVNEALPSFAQNTLTFDVKTSSFNTSARNMELKAEVLYDADEDADDNASEGTMRLISSSYPTVENLQGAAGNGVVLTWQTPTLTWKERTETFDHLSAWATSFGSWTLVDGTHGLAGGYFNSVQYPHQGEQLAYIIFNPTAISSNLLNNNPFLAPHSGDQYACVPYKSNGADGYCDGDEWLISPTLSGHAQTIKFYVHNITVASENAYFPEQFEVLYSATTKDTTNFVKLGGTYTISSGEWEEVTVELPEGANYFAIRHVTPASDAFMFSVDDVTYQYGSGRPLSFNVYRGSELLGSTQQTTFTDAAAQGLESVYAVTAVYADGQESDPVFLDLNDGINILNVEGSQAIDIYTLDGVKVGSSRGQVQELRKGIYVQDGKKMVVNGRR